MAGFESGYKAGVASTPKTSLGLEIASVGENYQKIKAQEKKLKDNFNKGREDFRAKWKESTGEDINEIDFNYTGIADVDGVYSAMSNASRKVLESANWAHNQNLVQDSELPKIGSMVTKGTAEFAGFMGQLKDNLDIDTELSKENKSSRVNKFISNNIGSAMKGIGFTFDENGFNAVFENGASVYTSNILENTEMREKLDLFDLSKEIIGTPGAEEVVDDKSLVKYYDRNKDYSKSIGIAVDGLDPRSMIDLAMQLDILEDKKTSIDGAGLKLGLDDLNSEDVREKLKPVVEKKLNEHLMETLGNRKEIKPVDEDGKEKELILPPTVLQDTNVYPTKEGIEREPHDYGEAALIVDILRPLGKMDDAMAGKIRVDAKGGIIANMEEVMNQMMVGDSDENIAKSKIDLANENPDIFNVKIERDSDGVITSTEIGYNSGLDIKGYSLNFSDVKPSEIGVGTASDNKWESINGIIAIASYDKKKIYKTNKETGKVVFEEVDDLDKPKNINYRIKGTSIYGESATTFISEPSSISKEKLSVKASKKDVVSDLSNPLDDAAFMKALPIILERQPGLSEVFSKIYNIKKQSVKNVSTSDNRRILFEALNTFNR